MNSNTLALVWLTLSIILLSGCTQDSSQFHFEGDGSKFLVQPEEMPEQWIFRGVTISEPRRTTTVWWAHYQFPENGIDQFDVESPVRIGMFYAGSQVKIYETEREAVRWWTVSDRESSQWRVPCELRPETYTYQSSLADQFRIVCSHAGVSLASQKDIFQIPFTFTVEARYGNMAFMFSADVAPDPEQSVEEANADGVLHWSQIEEIMQNLEQKILEETALDVDAS